VRDIRKSRISDNKTKDSTDGRRRLDAQSGDGSNIPTAAN
jgi:hypothetical protein